MIDIISQATNYILIGALISIPAAYLGCIIFLIIDYIID